MKAKTYLGFANKSGTIIWGIDSLKKSKKTIHLILISKNLSENGYKDAKKFANKINCEIYQTTLLTEMFANKSVKTIGITDINLANAIKKELQKL